MKTKHIFLLLFVVIILTMAVASFVGCGDFDKSPDSSSSNSNDRKESSPIPDDANAGRVQEELHFYYVTWKNWDDSELEIDNCVAHGELPEYNGKTPKRESDGSCTYTFIGWSPKIERVNGDITYTAQYECIPNTYTVKWMNWDGTVMESDSYVEYGSTPTYDTRNPKKSSDAQYTYRFSGWEPEIEPVTSDITYVAKFDTTVNTYKITWKNWDGSVLETDSDVPYGETPTYNGAEPQKAGDAEYTYTFDGWDSTIEEVKAKATYTAQFKSLKNVYTVTWKNWDGSVLDAVELEYGTLPLYEGESPIKDEDKQYTYTFSGWSPQIGYVNENIEYAAQYETTIKQYMVTWVIDEKTVEETYNYGVMPSYKGTTPTKQQTLNSYYTFTGWSPTFVNVSGNCVYTALFEESARTNSTIKYNTNGGSSISTQQTVNIGETVTLTSTVPTKSGYVFYGWNTFGDNQTYESGATYVANYDTTFYAIWLQVCSTCKGEYIQTQNVKCTSCTNGQRLKSVNCSKCGGSGYQTKQNKYRCSSCNGSGVRYYKSYCRNCGWSTTNVGGYVSRCGSCGYAVYLTNSEVSCTTCSGSGYVYRNDTVTCSTCSGSGKVEQYVTCTNCNGKGYTTKTTTCTKCDHGHVLPAAPEVKEKTTTTIELIATSGYEYSKDGVQWQDSPLFENLTKNTKYTFYQRKKETISSTFGPTSKPLAVWTKS